MWHGTLFFFTSEEHADYFGMCDILNACQKSWIRIMCENFQLIFKASGSWSQKSRGIRKLVVGLAETCLDLLKYVLSIP